MKEKRISFGQGKGSLTHNNRDFIAANVDESRIADNITFVKQPIAEAYDFLFAGATERYNAKQKRNDRKISNYYEHTFGCRFCNTVKVNALDQKSFYEDVVQIGKMEDSGYGTEDFQLVADRLKEYMEDFQKRNPNFYIFNAVLHMDEATPHLHIDYIPVGHYKRGQDTQNGIAQALKEMGCGTGEFAIVRWRASEVEVLNKICREHGIKPISPEKARGTVEVAEYKEQRRKADELAEQNVHVQAELDAADKLIAIKLTELNDTNDKILSSETELADKKQAISDSEEKLYSVTAEVEKTDTKLLQEREKVNTLLQYMPDIEKKQNAEHEYLVIISELHDMMKSGISILKKKTLSSAMLIDLKALYVKHWINVTKLIFPYMLYASVATSLLMNVIRLMKK